MGLSLLLLLFSSPGWAAKSISDLQTGTGQSVSLFSPTSNFLAQVSYLPNLTYLAKLEGFGNTERCFYSVYEENASPDTWENYIRVNGHASVDGGLVGASVILPFGNFTPGPYQFQIACGGTSNTYDAANVVYSEPVTINLFAPVAIDSFAINPAAPAINQDYTLSWATTGASSCTLDGQAIENSGEQTFSRAEAGEYVHALSCEAVLPQDTAKTQSLMVRVRLSAKR